MELFPESLASRVKIYPCLLCSPPPSFASPPLLYRPSPPPQWVSCVHIDLLSVAAVGLMCAHRSALHRPSPPSPWVSCVHIDRLPIVPHHPRLRSHVCTQICPHRPSPLPPAVSCVHIGLLFIFPFYICSHVCSGLDIMFCSNN